MQNQCQNSGTLIPSYLDGELSERQAAPLRRHLLECQPCRELAQDEQAMKRWFISEEAPVVPQGFAARVARRAFAGDTGILSDHDVELVPQVAAIGIEREIRTIDFVLKMTALAAAVMFVFALGIRTQSLPGSLDLGAETYPQVLEELEQLNASEAVGSEVDPRSQSSSKSSSEESRQREEEEVAD